MGGGLYLERLLHGYWFYACLIPGVLFPSVTIIVSYILSFSVGGFPRPRLVLACNIHCQVLLLVSNIWWLEGSYVYPTMVSLQLSFFLSPYLMFSTANLRWVIYVSISSDIFFYFPIILEITSSVHLVSSESLGHQLYCFIKTGFQFW